MRPRVVIAVSEPAERRWLARSLAPSFQVALAASGAEAAGLVDELDPPLAIFDQALPGLAGSDVCHRVRAAHPRMRCLVLVDRAFASVPEPVLIESLHADAVLARPLRFKKIAERLRGWGLPVDSEELVAADPLVDNDFACPKPRRG